jgi:hypothetical protein
MPKIIRVIIVISSPAGRLPEDCVRITVSEAAGGSAAAIAALGTFTLDGM